MATLNQILAEQAKLVGGAKAALEAAQKRPPTQTAPVAAKEAIVADLKARVAALKETKAELAAQIDQQIATYEAEIAGWEKQIEEDKNRSGDQPRPPKPAKRKNAEK